MRTRNQTVDTGRFLLLGWRAEQGPDDAAAQRIAAALWRRISRPVRRLAAQQWGAAPGRRITRRWPTHA